MPSHRDVRSTTVSAFDATDPKKCKRLILDTLWDHGGNVWRSARALGISRAFLWYLLRKHDMRKVPEQVREQFRTRYKVKM